jgi:tellurite resistance protein
MAEPDFAALWLAFRAKDRDRVIVGVAAAFAYVAAANGTLEPSETSRFLDVVSGARLAPADTTTREQLALAFEALALAIIASPALGRAECQRVLSDFGFDPMRSEIIWSATSAALVADAALDGAERQAAEEIRQALRLPSSPRSRR